MLKGLLRRWAELVYRHHVVVLLALGLATLVAGSSLLRLELSADVSTLLPRDSAAVKAYFDLKESFGADLMILVLEDDDGPVLEHADLVDELAETLAASPLVASVDYRVYDNVPTGLFLRHLPLLLAPSETDRLVERVSTAAIHRQIELDWIDLQGPMVPPLLKRLLREDPLRLLQLLQDRLVTSRGGYSLDVSSGYYVSHDDSTLLIFVRPEQPSDDIAFSKTLVAETHRLVEEAQAEYLAVLGQPSGGPVPGLSVGLTGAHAIAATESEVLQRDTIRAVLWSLACVLLLFVVTFRRVDAVLFVGLPLVAGLCWTFGLTWVVVGHLNLLSAGFAAVVLGLGVDYAIHIYNRYLDHRALGDDAELSIEAAIAETGAGVFIGAVTTAGAFFALMLYDFEGIRDFGFIAGMGVLLTLLAMLTLLPALLALEDRWRPTAPRRTLIRFYSREIVSVVARHPRSVVAASAAATLVLAAAATQVEWEGRVLGDDFSSNPALELRERLRSQFSSSPDSLVVVIDGQELDAVDAAGRRAWLAAEELLRSGRVGAVDSIYNYLQPPGAQQEVLSRLANDPDLAWPRIETDLRGALVEHGFNLRPFEPYIDTLRTAFHPPGPVGVAEVLASAGDSPFIERYVHQGRDGYIEAIYLTSGRQGFEREDIDAVEAVLARQLPEIASGERGENGVSCYLAGGKVLARELRQRMREGYAMVTAVALALVLGVLIASFRRPGRVLLALVPLTLGVTWMLGIMTLCGVAMNVVNVPVTAMILGIGIDDAVHVVHAFYKEAGLDVRRTYRTTGKALVLTTLTTIAGFGSLAVAGHPGLESMGLLAILGTASCLVATLVTMPALMTLIANRRGVIQSTSDDDPVGL